MTDPFTNAQLAAFLDGTLDNGPLIDAIENAINANPALAERIAALATPDETAAAVRDAFAPMLAAPVPEHLSRIVVVPKIAQALDFAASRVRRSLPAAANDAGTSSRAWRWPQFAGMAASLALGVWVGGQLLNGAAGDRAGGNAVDGALVLAGAGGAAAAPAVTAMLDSAPSGQRVDLASLGTGEVILSFRNSDGQLCRQFSIEGGAGTSDTLACAKEDGGWQVEAFGRRAPPMGEMRLAGGDAAVGVVAAVDAMIDSDPLVGADELAELANK